MSDNTDIQEKRQQVSRLLKELSPLTQHSDIFISARYFDYVDNALYLEVIPGCSASWAETAYKFASQENMKYDRGYRIYGIDGQPRVSYSGKVWVRYITPFVDDSKVAFHIWSQQPSHADAEEQLMNFYELFRERNGLEPMEVLQKYL